MAIAHGAVDEALKIIRSRDCCIDQPDAHGNHPLHTALHYDQLELAGELLALKCEVNQPEKVTNLCPIHIAAHKSSPECLDLLLEYDRKHCNAMDWVPIDLDVRDQTLANTALGLAAREGHFGIVQRLVSAGSDIDLCNAAGDTPLCLAITNGHADIVKLLLENGATLALASRGRQESLLSSCLYNHEEGSVLRVLLEHGLSPNVFNREGRTPLMHALTWLKWDMIDVLLDPRWGKSIDVNLTTPDTKETALFFAVRRASKHPAYVRMIIERGADVNHTNSDGFQALDIAVRNNAHAVVEILLNAGAKIWTRSGEKGARLPPPLVACCQNGFKDMANLLIFYGAPINASYYTYESPLMAAVRCRHFDVVDVLISAGCLVNDEKWLFHELKKANFLEELPQRKAQLDKLAKNPALLSDLCRSVTRQYLHQNNMPLLTILDLPQPTSIRNFLLLQ